jgi:hypothetical protein
VAARQRWLAARQKELLAVDYFHVVFTLPHQLSPLMLQNKKLLYDLLFRASAETLLEIALDPKHLGAEIGFLSVLHTWGQNLRHHPHIHCVIPAGGLAPDHRRWIHPRYHFLLPRHVLRRVFRGKFVDALKQATPSSLSPEPFNPFGKSKPLLSSCALCSDKTGSSTSSHRSAARNMSCAISPATPTASPFPITA